MSPCAIWCETVESNHAEREAITLPHPRDQADPAALELFRRLRDDIGAEVRRALQQQGLSLPGKDAA